MNGLGLLLILFGLSVDVVNTKDVRGNRSARETEDSQKTVGDEEWVSSLDFYQRFNQTTDSLKEVKQDVMQAFRWDIDCPFLNEVDRAFRQRQGRCPPDEVDEDEETFANSSTKDRGHEKHKRKRLFLIQDTKKHLLNFATFGKLRTPPKLLDKSGEGKLLIIEGHWLTLRCPLEHNEKKIENETEQHATWIVNGNVIEYKHYEWRLKVDRDIFEVFPVVLSDSGVFECWLGGEFRAWIEVEVISHWELIRRGMVNYAKVNIVYLMLFSVIMFHIWRRPSKVFKKRKQQNWSEAYLEHKLNDNVERAKESIAGTYYGDDLEKQKTMLKQKEFTAQETAAINRRILQTILDGCQNSN